MFLKVLKLSAFFLHTIIFTGFSQVSKPLVLTLEEAILKMKSNHPAVVNSWLELEYIGANKLGWMSKEPMTLEFFYGNTSDTENNYLFESQVPLGSVPAILRYRRFHNQEISTGKSMHASTINEMTRELKAVYYEWLFADKRRKVLEEFIGFFRQYPRQADTLQKQNFADQMKSMETAMILFGVENEIKLLEADIRKLRYRVSELIVEDEEWMPDHSTNEIFVIHFPLGKGEEFPGPGSVVEVYREKLNLEKEKAAMDKAELFPSLVLGNFNQSIGGTMGFRGVYAGLHFPIWEWISGERKRSRALSIMQARNNLNYHAFSFSKKIDELISDMDARHISLQYHYSYVLPYAYTLRENSVDRYLSFEIEFDELFENLDKARELEMKYLETLNIYNHLAIELEAIIQ